MEDIKIIDNSLDDREFRNYVCYILPKLGFDNIKIEDERIADNDKENDNDIIAKKDNISYTILTYLNREIGKKEIDEVVKDIIKEQVTGGVIVSNLEVEEKIKEEAKKENIEIIDRKDLIKAINKTT